MQCRCQQLNPTSFAFEVRKSVSGIYIRLRSSVLQLYLPILFVLESNPRCRTPDVVDGFHLLRNIDNLESQLQELRAKMQGSSPFSYSYFTAPIPSRDIAQLEAEMSLLVEGLVADDQVFESYGYENLYEKGFLTCDRWKSFQSSKTSRTLDWIIHTIDQFEGDEELNEMGSDDLPELLQTFQSMPSVPSSEITDSQYEFGGSVDDTDLPLIAAIYKGRNDVISDLLARGANPWILSHVKQEDQWLFAQSLLDHGVNATSLFESTYGFEHVEPRLLYVLMEKGADIYSSWPTFTQGSLTPGLHISDREIEEANSMRAHNSRLLSAIQRGDLRCAEEEISHGADPTFGIDSTLVGAKWDILRFLLQKGADPRVLEFGKPTVYLQEDVMTDACLLTVAEEGLPTVVKSLLHLRGRDKMVAERLRGPSLTKLIQYDRMHILRILFYKGVFSRDYLASSSKWSLPLAAETSMPLFGLLLSFGACASTALIAAVTDRNLTSVILLLKGIREYPMRGSINTLRVHNHMTLMMKAVDDGSVEIAQHLIDNGADPSIGTWCGDSFTIAEEKGFKGLSQMLGRAPKANRKAPFRWILDDWGNFADKYYFLWVIDCSVPAVREEDCLDKIKIHCLHREFRRQHTHISRCARASTDFGCNPLRKRSHSPAWGDLFDHNHSKAWSRGIAVMRGLCRGEAPSTLYDTIMFLALGKAICLSKIASSLSDHHAEFLADLGRWQVLFRSDRRSLSAFRNAVSDIWQISAEELDRVQPPYSTSLIHFQELAMSLITNVEQSFDRQGDLGKGLLASQERWGWNRGPEMPETQRPEPFAMQFPENTVERGKLTESDPTGFIASGITDASPSPGTQIPLVVLLMAGFVFSVVLVFLKGTSLEPGLIKLIARLILGALRAAKSPATAESVNINYH